MNLEGNIDTLFTRLEKFFRTETVVGEPIEIGQITLIPIINVTFGLGTGGGSGLNSDAKEELGGGAGVGAKISPDCIVVVKGDEVSLLPLNERDSLDKIIEMVPGLLKKIKKSDDKNQDEKNDERYNEKLNNA